MKEWNETVGKFSNSDSRDTTTEGPAIRPVNTEDDLANWLEALKMEDGAEETQWNHCTHRKVDKNKVGLYRCSYCGNPSAALRKCGGCTKVR